MKKAFDQTVRDLKRGVNKKVLKVPSIEQKVLDATSNEPWGPHGSLLSDIAQATRNYHEYQIIMSVIWKRINDIGKNWRHVYKALTVLEYLVAHGSERVIDDIREHAYQISTLSDFQYIDSHGKDQGNNVRKKSQSIVALVNDKERIQEVRQKAAANRDKYRSTAVGSMYYPGSGGYGDRFEDDRYDGRYGNRDDDRNGYGRDRDWGSRDDGRDYEDRYGRDGYRDDDYRGRSQHSDEYNYSSRSRSVDPDRNSANEDDGQYSSRGSGAKGDDHSQDGRGENLDRKYSAQNLSAPPSYEDVGTGQSLSYSDKDGEFSQPNAPKESNSSDATQKGHPTTAGAPTPASPPAVDPASIPTPAPTSVPASTTAPTPTSVPAPTTAPALSSQNAVQHNHQEVDGFDAFDPRGPFSVASTKSGAAPTSGFEMDLLGSLSIVPVGQPTTSYETADSARISSGPFQGTPPSTITNQPFDDPFGDGPFRAVPTTGGASIQPQTTYPTNSFSSNPSQDVDVHQPAPNATSEFAGAFSDASHSSSAQMHTSAQLFPKQELSAPNQDIDVLAGILPPSEPSEGGYPVPPSRSVSDDGFTQTNQPASQSDLSSLTGFNAQQTSQAQPGQPASLLTQHSQPSSQANYHFPSAESVSQTGFPSQVMPLTTVQVGQTPQFGIYSQTVSIQPNVPNHNFHGAYTSPSQAAQPAAAYMVPPSSVGTATMHSFPPQSSSMVPVTPQMGPQTPQVRPSNLVAPLSTHPSSAVPAAASQPTKDKFETKSTVWADTLSRGLVNLDISGSKANPLADIGVDFDSINRKEKRMEKPTTAAVTSTVTMGKAMGSGSGMGRTGAIGLRPSQNQMMGSGMNMGIGGGPGAGFGMGGGYGVNQPMGRGMGIPGNMGMNMNMGPGMNIQQPMGFPPGSAMPGGYNHMAGPGYSQQPHGSGYGYR